MRKSSSSAARPVQPMDPCYHLACDAPDQINDIALDEFSDAAAHVLMLLLQGEGG